MIVWLIVFTKKCRNRSITNVLTQNYYSVQPRKIPLMVKWQHIDTTICAKWHVSDWTFTNLCKFESFSVISRYCSFLIHSNLTLYFLSPDTTHGRTRWRFVQMVTTVLPILNAKQSCATILRKSQPLHQCNSRNDLMSSGSRLRPVGPWAILPNKTNQ